MFGYLTGGVDLDSLANKQMLVYLLLLYLCSQDMHGAWEDWKSLLEESSHAQQKEEVMSAKKES